MTGKTNGVDTWTYTWDTVDGRLTRVQGPGAVDVSYAYDSSGRMLSRDNGLDLTVFLWDEWHVARETTGVTTTTYCIPEGYLQSFIRDGSRFDAHLDALGSVRLVTDENGDVVSRFDFSAFGGLLEGSFDGVPGGMPYAWIGGFGIRTDADSGLIYMRSRWYDPQAGRFISVEPIRGTGRESRYAYCGNNPVRYIDWDGLTRTEPPWHIIPNVNPDTMRPRQKKDFCMSILRRIRTLRKSIFRRVRDQWYYKIRRHPKGDLGSCERIRNDPGSINQTSWTHWEDIAYDSRWLEFYYRQWVRFCQPDFDPDNMMQIPQEYIDDFNNQHQQDDDSLLWIMMILGATMRLGASTSAAPVVVPIIILEEASGF